MLSHHFDPTNSNITYCVRSFLAIVLVAQGPIPLEDLVHIISSTRELSSEIQSLFPRISRRLAQLLVGGRETGGQVELPHSSFRSILATWPSTSPFFPNVPAHKEMARICVHIMTKELRFNICQLPSSFIRNADIEDLTDRVKANISPHLRLACRTWTYHVYQLEEVEVTIIQLVFNFFRFHFLYWLEVISLVGSSAQEALAHLPLAKVS